MAPREQRPSPSPSARIAQVDAHLSSASTMTSTAPTSNSSANSSQGSLVQSFVSSNVRTVMLNRPKALNALNLEMVTLIRKELEEFLADQSASVLVLTHEGRAFCSGGDVLAVVRAADSDDPQERNKSLEFFQKEYELNYALAHLGQRSASSAVSRAPYDKTAIALLDGITMGGGVGLSVHIPFRVVTARTLWAMPETGIGFFPDVGVSRILARLDGGVGLCLALTGHRLKGWEVYYLGLGTHYVRSSSIALIQEGLAQVTTPVVKDVDEVLRKHSFDPLDPAAGEVGADAFNQSYFFGPQRVALDYVFAAHTYPQHTIQDIFTALEQLSGSSPSQTSAGQALVSGKFGHFDPSDKAWKTIADWAKSTIDTLHSKSPRSLMVVHRHLAEAQNQVHLHHTFEADMRRATTFCDFGVPPQGDNRDFYTGVTHVLEKDPATGKRREGSPPWQPNSVDHVNTDQISSFFFGQGNEQGLNLVVPKLDLGKGDNYAVAESYAPSKWDPAHNPFALPSDAECARLLTGAHPAARSAKLSMSELVETLDTLYKHKPGLKQKVLEWAKRTTGSDS